LRDQPERADPFSLIRDIPPSGRDDTGLCASGAFKSARALGMASLFHYFLGSSQEFVGEKEDLTVAPKKGWDIFSE